MHMLALGRRPNFGIVRTFLPLPTNLLFGSAVIAVSEKFQLGWHRFISSSPIGTLIESDPVTHSLRVTNAVVARYQRDGGATP